MSTPDALKALVIQLTKELDQVQQAAHYGVEITQQKLLISPNDAELTQLFAIFNNISFFTENYRERIQRIVRVASEAKLQPEQL